MSAHVKKHEFSKLRAMFFPIHGYEIKKVLPMGMIFFFILYNYTCLRNIKDAIVVPESGGAVIPFLKTYCVTPAAILFMVVYVKMSNMFSKENLFYATITPFLIFFGLFGFVFYPLKDSLHMSQETIESLSEQMPYLRYFFEIIGKWSFSLFYVLSEIWGSAILSLSFWQFANQVTRIPEAKRFYAFFGLMAQLALFLVAGAGLYLTADAAAGAGSEAIVNMSEIWGPALNWLMGSVVVFGFVMMAIYRWMHKEVLTDPRFYDPEEIKPKKKSKPKLTLGESFKMIFSSPYLGLIAMLVLAYGVSINLIEGVWKDQIKEMLVEQGFTSKAAQSAAYTQFVSWTTFWTGLASMLMMIVGGNILRLFRWGTAAMITPVMMLALGGAFFCFTLLRDMDSLIAFADSVSKSPVALGVLFGAAVIVMTKATKYALFDLTKEMAYIPLDDEMKVKGKAVVDVVGGRFGKTGGAFVQSSIVGIMAGITGGAVAMVDIASITVWVFGAICVLWMLSVSGLAKKVQAKAAEKHQEA